MLKAKIRGGRITGTRLHYEGSVAIDVRLMKAADILAGEQVHVLNLANGSRLVTYAIAAPAGSGMIELRGPAAREGLVGDEVVLLTYVQLAEEEARSFRRRLVSVGTKNRMVRGKRKK